MDAGLDFGNGITESNTTFINERSIDKLDKAVGKVKAQSGEGDIEVKIAKQRKIIKANDFCMVFYQNIGKLLSDGELNITRNDMRVLFKLLEYTRLGNLLSFSQTQIAKELGLTRQVVNRSLSNLKKKEVILETERGLFFNPLIICKGGYDQIAKEVMYQAKTVNTNQYSFNWDN